MNSGSLVLRHAIVRRAHSSSKSKVDAPDEEAVVTTTLPNPTSTVTDVMMIPSMKMTSTVTAETMTPWMKMTLMAMNAATIPAQS